MGEIVADVERAKRLGIAGQAAQSAALYEAILAKMVAAKAEDGRADEKLQVFATVVEVTIGLAEIYSREARFDSALEMAEMALSHDPTLSQHMTALVLKGEALCGIGQTEAGILAFIAAAEQTSVGGRLAAARAMARLAVPATPARTPGQGERLLQCAEKWGETLLRLPPQQVNPQERAEGWTILGLVAQAKGNRSQAIDFFRGALSAVPGYAEATRLLEELSAPAWLNVPNPSATKPTATKRKTPLCKPLMAAATRFLYVRNAFRLTALPVDALPRDITRQVDRLKIMVELNHAPAGDIAVFSPRPAPTLDEIRDALQRLKEPEARLMDELFWFWPEEFGKSRDDSALQALARGEEKEALRIWRGKEYAPEIGVTATHNLAVYWHCKALEQENHALAGGGAGEGAQELEATWSLALVQWNKLAGNASFWALIRTRAKQLDAERLPDSFCDSMEGWFLQAIDQASGDLALACVAAGRQADARRHAQRVKQAEAKRNEVGQTAERVLDSTKKRIEQHVAFAKSRGQANPEQGPKAAGELFHHLREAMPLADSLIQVDQWAPPSTASAWKTQFLQQGSDACAQLMLLALPGVSAPPQKRVDVFFKRIMPQWRQMAEAKMPGLTNPIGDTLAKTLTNIGADAHNQKDFQTGAKALEVAMQLCEEPQLKKKISGDFEIVTRAAKLAQCHFCGRAKGDAGAETHVWMWGDGTYSGRTMRVNHFRFPIPRCKSCKTVHRQCLFLAPLAAFFAALLAKLVCTLVGSPVAFPAWIGAGIGGGWLFIRWHLRRQAITDVKNFQSFVLIAESLKRGWHFGKRPKDLTRPKGMRVASFLLAGVFGAIVAGWIPESPPVRSMRYHLAVSHNNRMAYEKFLAAFPSGDYSAVANARLEAISAEEDWGAVTSSKNNPTLLRRFLVRYPHSSHATEARRLLNGELERRWANLQTDGTVDDIRAFRDTIPEFRNDPRVESRFEKLLWAKASADFEGAGDCASTQEFLDAFPNSQFAKEARDRLEDSSEKRWPALKNSLDRAGLKKFINDFHGLPRERDAIRWLRAVNHGWTSDLPIEFQNIESDKASLAATERDLALDKESIEDEHQRLNAHDNYAIGRYNMKVNAFNQKLQEERKAKGLLQERIDNYNERLRSDGK
jgi:tetratricopeptide (TPR) repeat protein